MNIEDRGIPAEGIIADSAVTKPSAAAVSLSPLEGEEL